MPDSPALTGVRRHFPSLLRLPVSERLWLGVVLAGVVASVGGFSFFASPERLDALLKYAGLGLLSLALGAFLLNLYRTFRGEGLRTGAGLRGPLGTYWRSGALWLVCCLGVLTLFPKGNRTLMDEISVLATSKTILEEREPYTGYSVMDTNTGPIKIAGGYTDKRPFLFATLVATAHGFFGYSPANAFYVNMALGALTLFLVWLLGFQIGGGIRSGDLAMVALASLPLFAEHATGGGIDVLNLALLALLTLLAIRQLQLPSVQACSAMVGAAVLLAHARYESTMFMALPATVILIGFLRTGRTYVGWSFPVYLASMLPLAAIHYLTFSRAAEWFQLGEKGLVDAFSVSYVWSNLEHAIYFFFNGEHQLTNSPLLGVAGVIGLLLALIGLMRSLRRRRASAGELAFALLAAGVLGGFGLLMCYSWGDLDSAIASRLSLPLYLLLALAIGYSLKGARRKPRFYRVGLVLLVGSFYWTAYPVAAKNYNQTAYWTAQILNRCDEFLDKQPDRHFAIVTGSYPTFWLTRNTFFMTPWALKADRRPLARVLFTRAYRRLYVVEIYQRDSHGKMVLQPKLGSHLTFEGETVLDDLLNDDTRVKVTLVDRAKPFTVGGRVVDEADLRGNGAAAISR